MIKTLTSIQSELKAPKGQYNSFGQYRYRSCEDILEAVKPILAKHNAALTLTDNLEMVGDRFYVKATATLYVDGKEPISVSAYAREDAQKKGMDGSQITGTASSYARKYALNGLFCIDDTKDEDSNELREQNDAKAKAQGRMVIDNPTAADIQNLAKEVAAQKGTPIDEALVNQILHMAKTKNVDVSVICKRYRIDSVTKLTREQGEACLRDLNNSSGKQ